MEEFNNERGQFVVGEDRYIFAFGFDGIRLAHPFRLEEVEENQIDLRDENGVLLIRNFNTLASNGGGFAYYVRPNAQHNNTPELKLSYIAKVDDDWWIGTGTWLSDIPAVFNAEPRLSLVTLVDRAVAYAQANGKENALEEFNDVNGDFVDGDYYIFAYDFNGTVLALPFQPELPGKDRSNEQDIYGALYVRDVLNVVRRRVAVYSTTPTQNPRTT